MSRSFDDAANQYLSATIPAISEPFTFSGWGWTDDTSISSMFISIGDADGLDYHGIRFRGTESGDPIQATSWDGVDGDAAEAAIGYVANKWYHVVGVYAASDDRRCYANGGNKGTNAGSRTVTGIDVVTIGVSADSTPVNWASGCFADIAVWDVALTDRDVWALWHGIPPWRIRPAHLVGFWLPFGDRTDRDFSGRGHHLTAHNTPSWGPEPAQMISRYQRCRYQHTDQSGRPWWRTLGKSPVADAMPMAMDQYRMRRI